MPADDRSLTTVRAVRSLLGRAFATDPLLAWFFPDAATREHTVAAGLGLFAEQYVLEGTVDLAGPEDGGVPAGAGPLSLAGAALWHLPDPRPADPRSPGAPGLAPLPDFGALLEAITGAEHAAAVGECMARARRLDPPGPAAYLHLLAVEPALQGNGVGSALLRRGLERAGARGLAAWLRTATRSNVAFYVRFGFEVVGATEVVDGPTIWTLVRPA